MCDFVCVCSTVCGCATVCLSWRGAVSQHLEANLGNKCLKVGQPPAKCTTQQVHFERHKVSRKLSTLQDGSGKRTTN